MRNSHRKAQKSERAFQLPGSFVPFCGHFPLLLLFGFLLSACSVGPKYKTPATPVPPAFKEAPPENFKETDQWKPAAPQDDRLRGDWWEMFSDPQLNDLEAQVNVSNQNIAAAEAQFRAARAAVQAARSGLFPSLTDNGS